MPERTEPAYTHVRSSQVRRSTAPPSLSLMLLTGIFIPVFLAYILATTSETKVTAVIVGVLGLLAVFARPFWGLIFFIALLYMRPEENIPALQGMRLTLMVSLVTLAATWISLFLRREPAVKTPINWLIIGFGAVVVATSVAGGTMAPTLMEISRQVVLVLLVLNLVRTPQRYHAFVTALIVFTAYLALYSVLLYFAGKAGIYAGVVRSKATGLFEDPNDLAATLVAGLALAISRVGHNHKLNQIFYVALSAVIIFGILLTNSRGGLLALLVVMGGYFLVFTRHKAVAITMAVLVSLLLLAIVPGRMTDINSKEESAMSRLVFWENGLHMLASNPISGVGYGSFEDYNTFNEKSYTAHNSFVLCFAELGFAGYLLWMGCIYYGYRRPRNLEETTEKAKRELLGARLALTGFLAACFWISRTYTPVMFLLISLPMAQMLSHSEPPGVYLLKPEDRRRDLRNIILICLGSIALIQIIVWIGLR